MSCNCGSDIPNILIVEADYADPIWCGECRFNLDLDDFNLPKDLLNKLSNWSEDYGDWIDWETDKRFSNANTLISQHNIVGLKLTEKIRVELGENYTITFSPTK
ncbi:hypothetical protein MKZ08_06430 [Viridibacillus sp. FSL R5-0477]|uniref:Uncharacterized protein n=1 Tax=Viridibacillus arenosi FSL R5-213 TaxID=1227360 RepID=W4ENZ4_9BACL|nr:MULTISPECIES: hypothetical protein [Viridibacillus]ETT82305.1 hypothetical protein C176_14982 [Viridibacillus arenosi FSL R5-213]OMC83639.1 hypothetical protein BK128_18185 [Viridibacillus sp. FSL H7-0596]OMC85288.1 hypothetical protein BK130_00520 [Viridibacillus sp. FSL H8-0123]OMC92594.1 hypothetical protein BK137_06015 [Viridibacillus arenosi]